MAFNDDFTKFMGGGKAASGSGGSFNDNFKGFMTTKPTPVKQTQQPKPQVSQSTPAIAQPQNQSFFQKVGNFIGNTIPQTIDSVKNIIKDPLNKKSDPSKAIGDLLKTPVEAYQGIQKNVSALKTDLKGKNTPVSQTAGDVLKTIASQGNFVISPISALFNAANDVPAIGTVSKILMVPFSAIGEATPKGTSALIDKIPDSVMPQRAKDNLKPGIGEIVALAAQLVAGHAMDVGGKVLTEKPLAIAKEKVTSLVDRFGKEDAKTIQEQAVKLAEEQITKEAEAPKSSDVQSFQNNISEYKRFGGFTEGTHAPDAAVRDMSALIDKPEIIQYTQSKLQSSIAAEAIKVNPDGTITLYRGGEPSPKNDLTSYSYKKDIAQSFVDEGQRKGQQIPLIEVKVKPEDIKVFVGGAEAEVMLSKDFKGASVMDQKAIEQSTSEIRDAIQSGDIEGAKALHESLSKDMKLPAFDELQKEVEQGHSQALASASKEITKNGGKHAAVIEKFKTFLRRNKDKRDKKTGERYSEHIPDKAFGISSDEVATDLGKTESEFMQELLSNLDKNSHRARGINTKAEIQEAASIKKTLKEKGIAYDKFESLQSLRDKLKNEILTTDEIRQETNKNLREMGVPENEIPKQKVTEQPKEIPIPRDQMPVGQGKEKISRLEERVTEALGSMTPELREKLGLSTYNEMNKKDQIADAAKYVLENPDEALAVLRGEKQAPKGLLTNSIYIALHNAAKDDSGLARKLTTFSATRAGQEISILTEIDKNSPVSIVTQLYKFREAAFRKIHGGKSVEKVIKEKVSKVKVKAPQMTDWKALIDQIKC